MPCSAAEVLHLSLREVGVALDLVDRRHHRGAVEKRRQVLDHEVADPDRTDLAVSEQGLQGTVGLQRPVERRRQRLVQDQQVDLVDAELAGALLEAVQRLVVPVVADPNLGLQKTSDRSRSRAAHRLADLALVAVGRRGVDVAVAAAECRPDGVAGLIGRRLKYPETERGHLDAVVERDRFHPVHPGFNTLRPSCCRPPTRKRQASFVGAPQGVASTRWA